MASPRVVAIKQALAAEESANALKQMADKLTAMEQYQQDYREKLTALDQQVAALLTAVTALATVITEQKPATKSDIRKGG